MREKMKQSRLVALRLMVQGEAADKTVEAYRQAAVAAGASEMEIAFSIAIGEQDVAVWVDRDYAHEAKP